MPGDGWTMDNLGKFWTRSETEFISVQIRTAANNAGGGGEMGFKSHHKDGSKNKEDKFWVVVFGHEVS